MPITVIAIKLKFVKTFNLIFPQ